MWTLKTSDSPKSQVVDQAKQAWDELMGNENLGFKNLQRIIEAIDANKSQKKFLDQYEHIVVLGCGGSSLGAKALSDALFKGAWEKKLTFFDNVDAQVIDNFLSSMEDPEKYGWVLCSKSGSTIEVLSLYEYCFHAIQAKYNQSVMKQSLVITENKPSPLFNFAKEQGIPQLDMPIDVGGRFSVFTSIGLFPLQALGFNNEKAYSGFSKALESSELICELSAILYSSQIKKTNSLYSFQYCERLTQWSLWLQQLWSESLAKQETRSGVEAPVISAFIPCRGVADQHSVLQQIIEGQGSKIVCFHNVRSSGKSQYTIDNNLFPVSLMKGRGLGDLFSVELDATEQAIRESGAATLVLSTDELDEESMGFLMGMWMLTIGVLGEMFDINAFDQPGVESGKQIARRVLGKIDS